MTFEQIEEAFIPVWESIQDFVPLDSITEGKRVKRPRFHLVQESSKKMKTAETSQEQQFEEPKDLSEEEIKKMMQIVPMEEIIRVGDHTEIHQTFEDVLKRFDKEDLDKLWSLVKEAFRVADPTEDKEREIWVELKRLYEQDPKDKIWALQKFMHDPLEWKLYDTCGVHHVSTRRGHEIFMLVEKDYPLTKGLATLMI
ncbi:hypothetical protein Tco_0044754 [Tanacetum coccineum]